MLQLEQHPQVFPEPLNLWGKLFLLAFGPFIETINFQIGLNFALRIVFELVLDNQEAKSNSVLIPSILISAIIFGELHFYNIIYIIVQFFVGLLFWLHLLHSHKKRH